MSASIYDLAHELQLRDEIDAFVASLTWDEALALLDWTLWRLPHQTPPPGDWRVWVMLCGRGSGKTRGAASQIHEWAKDRKSLGGGDILIAGQTYSDVREIQVEGPSGLLATAPYGFSPTWQPGNGILRWPNGVRGVIATGDVPKSFRGGNIAKAWCDELSWWQYPRDCWDNMQFSLRVGDMPQVVVSMTPTADPLICELEDDAKDAASGVVITRAGTSSNPHLSPASRAYFYRRYAGTRIGRQELDGEVLRDILGALLSQEVLDMHRVRRSPPLGRIVVAVDPVGTDDKRRDDERVREAGIIVAGRGAGEFRDHAYTLEDLSGPGSTVEWASRAVAAYHRWGADAMIGEVNFGGDMVEAAIRAVDRNVNFKAVRASRGKRLRAEPVAALHEQGRVHHVGVFVELERQWTSWVPDRGMPSPDRLDAEAYAITELLLSDDDTVGPVDAYLEMVR